MCRATIGVRGTGGERVCANGAHHRGRDGAHHRGVAAGTCGARQHVGEARGIRKGVRMSEVNIIIIAFLAALAGGCFASWKVGYRRGVRFAASQIVRIFQYNIASTNNELESIPALMARPTLDSDGSLRQIADKLHFAAWNEGRENESITSAPEHDESAVTMPTMDLWHVAWLSDLGFRDWISPDASFRIGDRPAYEEAERAANILETFERRIVPNLLTEDPEQKESRFTTAENRMHRVWRAYGKL
jgi:hypothetical protein